MSPLFHCVTDCEAEDVSAHDDLYIYAKGGGSINILVLTLNKRGHAYSIFHKFLNSY
jgi:hypothetical protein